MNYKTYTMSTIKYHLNSINVHQGSFSIPIHTTSMYQISIHICTTSNTTKILYVTHHPSNTIWYPYVSYQSKPRTLIGVILANNQQVQQRGVTPHEWQYHPLQGHCNTGPQLQEHQRLRTSVQRLLQNSFLPPKCEAVIGIKLDIFTNITRWHIEWLMKVKYWSFWKMSPEKSCCIMHNGSRPQHSVICLIGK